MGQRFDQPDNEDAFEQLCLRFYRKRWNNEGLKLYGKRGEKQDGIDIFDPFSLPPVGAVQCKFHEPHKTIPPAEIKSEVEQVEKSPLGIERYVIATTARKTKNAQDTVAELNRRPNKQVTIDIHFWEDICHDVGTLGRVQAEIIIYGQSDLAAAIEVVALQATLGAAAATSQPEPSQPTALTGLLAEIEKLLDDRQFELARHELAKHPDGEAAKALPTEEQYQLLRFRGRLALDDHNWGEASRLFLEAYAVAPESNIAKQNHVLGLMLSGDAPAAYAAAEKHIADGVNTPDMAVRLIDCTASVEQIEKYSAYIAAHQKTKADVSTSLCHRYLQLGEYTKAQASARRAVAMAPASPHAHLALAMADHSASQTAPQLERLTLLRSAVEHYDAAEAGAIAENYPALLPEILVNRGAAHSHLDAQDKAAADFRNVVSVAGKPETYAVRSIEYFLQASDFQSAWELVASLDRSTLEGQYLTLVIDFHNGNTDEKQRCLSEMQTLAGQQWERTVDSVCFSVQWALELGKLPEAKAVVSEAFLKAHPFQAHTLLAWINVHERDTGGARVEADKALGESIRNAHPQDLRLLGRILVQMGDDANAVGILERVTVPGVLDDEMKELITCAQRLGRHDLLLRLCEELRTAGTRDAQLQRVEVELLNRYAPEKALALAEQFISDGDSTAFFRAWRNALLLRLRRTDDMELDPAGLPKPTELLPGQAPLILGPYVEAGRFDDAIRFAYAQRRHYFEEEQAHTRYVFLILQQGSRTAFLEPPEAITADVAVHLQISDTESRWVIIENDQPVASRDEFAEANELSQCLIGRKVGDTVALPGHIVQQKTAVITEVQSKYVRAFQDAMQNFQRRFPESSVLQSVSVGTEDQFDPTAIIESLKGRREYVEKCFEIYRHYPCPLHRFAEQLGITELDAVQALASHEKGIVRCNSTTPEEYEKAATRGMESATIVLDVSALVTLTLLNGFALLDSRRKYLVSQLTSERIEGWIDRAEQSSGGGTVSLADDGLLVVRETTPEERAAKREQLERLREAIKTHCDCKSSLAVASIDPDKRERYEQLLGLHNVETLGVASETESVLWTDDCVMGMLGKTDFEIETCWTQLALRRSVREGHVTEDQYDLVTAKLAAWDYTMIVWSAKTLAAAGQEANWDTEAWPLRQGIGLIAKSEAHVSVTAHIVLEFLRLLSRSDCIEIKQSCVVRSALHALDSTLAVRWMLRRLDSAFGLDVAAAEFMRLELEYWLGSRIG